MSTSTSFIYVNPIEPGPMSLRLAAGVENRIDLTYYDQLGVLFNVDLAGQIELTPRSIGGHASYFPVPAIDVVNGRARAVIPVNTLVDRNGYRLHLYGTLNGEGILLAKGTVAITETPGIMSMPIDIIDTIDLVFFYEEPVSLDVRLWADGDKDTPYDLTTVASVSSNIYDLKGGVLLMPFTVTVINSNTVLLQLTTEQVNSLPKTCWWNLLVVDPAGSTTLAEGVITVSGALDAPIPVTIADWEYLKPATLDNPLTGQIVHSGITQNCLRISPLSYNGFDQTPLISKLEKDDRITIGGTTWGVQAIAYNNGGWYEVIITPVAQAATSGVVPVKFEPPA